MELGAVLVIWALLAWGVAGLAGSRGRSALGFFLLSFFLSPLLGLVIVLVMADLKKVEAADAQRRYDEQKHVETMRALTQPAQASTADELTKLVALKAAGALTEEEFTQQKARLLSR